MPKGGKRKGKISTRRRKVKSVHEALVKIHQKDRCYTGTLSDANCVYVADPTLFQYGIFGKGFFSRSEPLITSLNPRLDWLDKENPEKIENEGLALSLFEAFYLQFAMNSLTVDDMDIETAWKTYCLIDPTFWWRYAAYHYFRSKGWIPRIGLNYGCDFLLYKYGPGVDHGQFCVICTTDGKFAWRELHHQLRMTISVKKQVMFCHIDITKVDQNNPDVMNDPNLIREIEISYCIFSRIVVNPA